MAKRILLLEDNNDILEIICEVLTYEGYELHCINSCKHIMAEAALFRPNLVILDYRLQDGNGAEVARWFKADEKLRHIPLLLCSAYLPPHVAPGAHFEAIIHKPFNLDELLTTVNRIVRQHASQV